LKPFGDLAGLPSRLTSAVLYRLPMRQQYFDLTHRQLKIVDVEHAASAAKA